MRSVCLWAGAVAGTLLGLAAGGIEAARAETRLDARYNVRLALLPLNFATGSLKASFAERGRYSVDLGARGMGFGISGKSVGALGRKEVYPASAAIDSRDSEQTKRSIRIALSRGTVRMASIVPPLDYRPDRVPLTEEHRRNVIDPLSAMLMPVASGNDVLNADNCNRTLPIFEGTERFDIRLSYLRTETVKTQKGYSGPVLVCRATYKPIAGHRPRKQVEFMEENRTIEAWLAPVEGASMLAPWKVSLSTMVGTLVIEANQFVVAGDKVAKSDDRPSEVTEAEDVVGSASSN